MTLTGGAVMLAQIWSVLPEQPTIGDTVVLEREVIVADPAARLRLTPLDGSPSVEPLARPEVISGAGGFVARYLVALFETGEHAVVMPDLELVYPNGRVETRVGGQALVTVLSVLPEGDSLPPPRASREPIPRDLFRASRAALLFTGVVVLSLGWGVLRRKPRRRPAWVGTDAGVEDIPVSRWIAAGEPRAVATASMHRLREQIRTYVPQAEPSLDLETWLRTVEEHRSAWPVRELADIMRALERASYAPAIPSDVIALADESQVLLHTIDDAESTPEADDPEPTDPDAAQPEPAVEE